jgi:peptide/nickel transport system substrate-binding protein
MKAKGDYSQPRRARAFAAVAVAVLVIALSACGSSKKSGQPPGTGSGSTSTANSGAAVDGGTLRLIHDSDPPSLDPTKLQVMSETFGADMFFDVYSVLLYPDTTVTPPTVKPLLAESFTTQDNGTTWVLKLRPNVNFSDGTPLDAAAVKFNWQRLTDPANAAPQATSLADVASETVTDPQTLTVTLKTPNTLFNNTIAASAATFIASPTAIQKEGADFGKAPVGAGAFLLKSWTPGSQSTMVRNPNYFDAKDVHLDGLSIIDNINNTAQENAFATGEVDMTFVGQNTIAQSVQQSGGTVTRAQVLGPLTLVWNMNKAPFTDRSMRVAFAQALDRDALAKAWNAGMPDPQPKGLLPPSSPYYDAKAVYPAYDPAAAKTTIESYIATHGPIKLTFLFVSGSPATVDLASVLQQQLQAIPGVTVSLSQLDLSAYVGAEFQGRFDVAMSGIPFPDLADPFLYNALHSKESFNVAGYSNPQVDAAFDNARTTTDSQKQLADYNTVQEQVTADAYYLPVASSVYAQGYSKKVHFFYYSDAIPRTDLIWLSK